jgi:hypothetical protein
MPRNSTAHRQRRKQRHGYWVREIRFRFNEKWGDRTYPRIAIFRLRRSDMTAWLVRVNPDTLPEQVDYLFEQAQTLPAAEPTTLREFYTGVREAKMQAANA